MLIHSLLKYNSIAFKKLAINKVLSHVAAKFNIVRNCIKTSCKINFTVTYGTRLQEGKSRLPVVVIE